MKYLVDTNVYIESFNNVAFGERFRVFHRKHLPQLVLSAVVAHELLIGAEDDGRAQTLSRYMIEPLTSGTYPLGPPNDRTCIKSQHRYKSKTLIT